MNKLRSGWNMPPGCFKTPYDEPDPPCAVCAKPVDACICPECRECGEQGNPDCYTKGHMSTDPRHPVVITMPLTREQVVSRQEARIKVMLDRLEDEQFCLDRLHDLTQEFSSDLADSPDPWA